MSISPRTFFSFGENGEIVTVNDEWLVYLMVEFDL